MKQFQGLFYCGVVALMLSCSHNDTTTNKNTGSMKSEKNSAPIVEKDSLNISIKTYPVENGWGYDIFMDGVPYIHQPHIPALSGTRGFDSEADAQKIASLAVYKIKHHIIPPTISVEELDSLGVR